MPDPITYKPLSATDKALLYILIVSAALAPICMIAAGILYVFHAHTHGGQ